MKYAKLNNGVLEFAPLNYQNILNFNKDEELMRQYGFKLYSEDDVPTFDDTYQELHSSFQEDESSIVKTYTVVDFRTKEDVEEELKAKEQARIQELSMTKSDFFDGTIKAFGLDKNDLQPAVEAILNSLELTEIEKKIALNNFENAKDFYRKHTLFTLLSDREIPISEDLVIKISSTQWDRFFDETNKRNPEAYKALIS